MENMQVSRSGSVIRKSIIDWEKAAWVILLTLAIISRTRGLGERVISHDESLHTYYSWQLYKGHGFEHTPLMHGPFQFHAIAASYFLFGASDATARIPSALFGVAAVGLVYAFRSRLGRSAALCAGILMLISPFLVYYSRYVRNESFVVVWALLMVLATFRYSESRNPLWLYVMAGVMALNHATKEVAFIYDAIWLLFLGWICIRDVLGIEWARERLKNAFRILIVVGGVSMALAAASYGWGDEVAARYMDVEERVPAYPVEYSASHNAVEIAQPRMNVAATGALGIVALSLSGCVLVAVLGMGSKLRQLTAVDLIVVMGTLVLPQLVAFPVRMLLNSDPLDYSVEGMWVTGPALALMLVSSVAIGLWWNWRRWVVVAAVFYAIYLFLFTTMFTNGGGVASGIVGSLGYWLEQQGVERGGQPWYYYLVVTIPMYEYLPMFGVAVALVAGIRTRIRLTRERLVIGAEQIAERWSTPKTADGLPFLGFVGFWLAMTMVGYSLAGEKMPWLTVHIALPMILLAGWGLGKIVDGVDWRALGQLYVAGSGLIVLIVIAAIKSLFGMLFGTKRAFQGIQTAELEATTAFLAAAAVVVGGAAGIWHIRRRVGMTKILQVAVLIGVGLLVLLTVRTSMHANYINFDNQTEFINYASGAPGIKVVMEQVDEISQRTTDGSDIRVAFDDDVSWPFTWYLRDYGNQIYFGGQPSRASFQETPLVITGDTNWARVEPLLGNNYHAFEYIRMWWPMQDYFNLSRERIIGAITDARLREAIWDIWLNRDYRLYGELTGVDYSLANWPVVDRMRFYVRKDLAATLWSIGVGPVILEETVVTDEFEALRTTMVAEMVVGEYAQDRTTLNQPRDVAVGPDKYIYVANTFNHRIEKFDANGDRVMSWGGYGVAETSGDKLGLLNEPWGIDVGHDGHVYVADTWNHRVQKYTETGEFVTSWGRFGNEMELDNMWGPRDVAVGPEGHIYVADTGNKRISVFDESGTPIRQLGNAGSQMGQLDEPVGVAVTDRGEVYVADTWNQRVQVFDEEGAYARHFDVFAWFGQSLDNKPYLAIGGNGQVYFTDPEGSSVYVTDELGEARLAWGDYGTGDTKFVLPTGIDVGEDGKIYVADTGNNRVLVFAPMP